MDEIAHLDGVVEMLERKVANLHAAAQRLVDGASGNGSRMIVSKADMDALIDALASTQ